MGLEKVVESIRESGRKEAEHARENARREAAALVSAAEAKAHNTLEARRREAEGAAEALRRRELAAAELEAKKMRLEVEREVLAKVRSEVESRIAKLPASDRAKHVKALATKAAIPNGRVLVAEQDAEAAKAAGVVPAGTFRGLGGVVVESADRSTSENLRYENVLDDAWRANLQEVAGVVFGKRSS